ncbi:MAG: hypothetical protein QXX99_05925 [Candidatus Bathyarchaeia archaeon]
MIVLNDESLVIDVFRRVFRKILFSSLDESAGGAILFFLHEKLGRYPFEVFWENTRAVYHIMEEIFGAGTKVLINLILMSINKWYNIDMSLEHFLDLISRGNKESIEEIRFFLRKIAESCGHGGYVK